MALLDQILQAESGGNPLAKNPRSSATGLGQFISSSWLDILAKHRPDLTTGRSPEEILALRNDPELSKAMTGAYAGDNAKMLQQAGLPVNPGTVYLAHFAGPKGAVDILKSDPATPVENILGGAAMKANPFLSGMTVADLKRWASFKVGGADPPSVPAETPTATPAPADQPGPVPFGGPPAMPQMPFNPQPQAAPAQPLPQSFGSLGTEQPMPTGGTNPMIDLSQLKRFLAQYQAARKRI